jgi:flagellin
VVATLKSELPEKKKGEKTVSNSIQTNVDSIIAQNNLTVNDQFESSTIQRLTSGYRINSSRDDSAGLAVANQFRSDVAELNQGVRNANDGISALEIVDGGLTNISQMLDRLKTLATQSASDTFSGDRGTLNQEYQTLLGEIDRQADNIGLGTGGVGGRYSKSIGVYIGGSAGVQTNALVNVDLKGAQVNSAGLGVLSTNILGGSSSELDGSTNLSKQSGTILSGGATETFAVRTVKGGLAQTTDVTITGSASGLSATDVVNQFNQQLNGTGVSAAIGTDGKLQFFGGDTAFSIDANAPSAGTGVVAAAVTNKTNQNLFTIGAATVGTAVAGDALNFSVNGTNINIAFGAGDTASTQAQKLNAALNPYGIQAVMDSAGTGYSLQGAEAFTATLQPGAASTMSLAGGTAVNLATAYTMNETAPGAASGADTPQITVGGTAVTINIGNGDTVAQQIQDINTAMGSYGIQAIMNGDGAGYTLYGSQSFSVTTAATKVTWGASASTAPTGSTSNIANANSALAALTSAVTNLGQVQGKVGTGQNQLQYAVDLANSQISSFSAAESRIRDADVASEAANLTKAQVLQQSSIAALAQANQEPQALLSLIKNA